ncbi:MAG: putative peptidoglycan-binding domain-containing protein [Allosphingosinicella sp.]|uniref:putative peptidoglycan-binding domain-containing protein n=1 Tax=Allosphingosinicella sp. TaxID=2823234 RepID=UPI00393734C3
MGQRVAAQFLQRALNAFLGETVAVDGRIGPRTETAVGEFKRLRAREGEAVLVAALDCLQGAATSSSSKGAR